MGKSAFRTAEPLAVKPKEAARMLGLGLTRVFELIRTGEVDSYLDGGSRLVTVASIRGRIERKVAEAKAAGAASPAPSSPPSPEPAAAAPARGRRKRSAAGDRAIGEQPT